MLIAMLGAQGVGKTTLLKELALLDYTVDNFKVSRTIQKEMGYRMLSEAVATFDKMRQFQENIIERKYQHDLCLSQRSGKDVVFVERSFYDILAYTELWSQNFTTNEGAVDNWLSGYKQACIEYQKEVYNGLILIEPNSHISFENDPERATEQSQKQVDTRLKELCFYSERPVQYIKELSLHARVEKVIAFVPKL
jgi:predicted ATPase